MDDARDALPRVRVRWTGVRRMDASDPFLQRLEVSPAAAVNATAAASTRGLPSLAAPPLAPANTLFFTEREYSETPYVVRVVNNCVAFLHRGSHVVERSFVFPDRVLDAVMAHFAAPSTPLHDGGNGSSPSRNQAQQRSTKRARGQGLEVRAAPHLCVLVRSDCVNIYTPSGEVYEAALPFQASRLFAMEASGLLMQRSPAVQPSSSLSQSSQKSSADTPNSTLFVDKELASRPRFFTLAHPLDEVKPVALAPQTGSDTTAAAARSTSSDATPPRQAFLCDPALEIVALAQKLLICFHSQDRRFFVYALQKCPVIRSQRVAPVQVVDSATWQRHRERESDDDESDKMAIVPEWSATPVWESAVLERSSSSDLLSPLARRACASTKTAFMATDLDLAPLLCLVDKQSGVLILKRTGDFASELQAAREGDGDGDGGVKMVRCRDALPMSVDTPQSGCATDIVVLHDDRRLVLYRGVHRICELVPPSGARDSWPSTTEMRAIDGAVSFEVCGHSVKEFPDLLSRCEHPLRVDAESPLLEKVFGVLQHVLPAGLFLGLQADTVARHQQQQEEATTSDKTRIKEEWEVFCSFLIERLDRASHSHQSGDDGASDEMEVELPAETESAFDKLCRSKFHQTYRAKHPMLFMRMDASSSVRASREVISSSSTAAAAPSARKAAPSPLQSHAAGMFAALHLLHEDMKLSVTSSQCRQQLAALQLELAAFLGLDAYSAYYQQETGSPRSVGASAVSKVEPPSPLFPDWEHTSVPDIVGWIHAQVRGFACLGSSEASRFPTLPSRVGFDDILESRESGLISPLWRTAAVCRIYELLTPRQAPDSLRTGVTQQQEHSRRDQRAELMAFLTQNRFGIQLSLQGLPFGIQFPIVEAISEFRHAPPPFVTEDICHFIGREDLAGVVSSRVANSQSSEHAQGHHASQSSRESAELQRLNGNQESRHEASDGLEEMVQLSQPLFPLDQRMKEVARLIRSNRPLCLKLEKSSDTSDQDFVQQQQARLLLLCKRSMSLPVARGMVTLGSFDMNMAQNHAWQLRVPELPLAGRTPPTNATVALDVSGYAKELTFWPQFHNGCAAGLRLPARDLSSVVNRYWIKYHRPSVAEHQARSASQNSSQAPSPEATKRSLEEAYAAHAGLLLGLGLRGHLKCLSMADVYNYLSLSNEFVTVAILLGMATTAAHCRQRRKIQSQEFKKHGSSRDSLGSTPGITTSPESSGDPGIGDVSLEDDGFLSGSASKAPPLVGSGLELTLERSVSKMLCLHIPSLLPPPFAEFSVPASTQTAALLGLGILYQATGHRLMTELLLTEIARSPSSAQFVSSNSNSGLSTASFDQLEGYALAAGLALGLVVLGRGQAKSGDPGLADMKLEEKLYKYIVGGAQQFGDANAAGGCLYRGRKWNALGASSSSFGGARGDNGSSSNGSAGGSGRESKSPQDRGWRDEHVNIGVTACGSALALAFMYMQTENRSIAAQLAIPDTLILLDYVRPDILLVRTLARNLVMWESVVPTTEWVEATQVPTQLRSAYNALQTSDSQFADSDLDSSASSAVHSDAQSICEAYANVIAGACFSLGFRFAGTADDRARQTLKKYVFHFRDMRSKAASSGMNLAGNAAAAATERVTIERCLAVCAQALALVDAGTGNIETLTLLRSINLRQRVDSELTYGNHMALSTAIGLLFIGGGRATVSRSKEAIAALVIALFPMYPMNTADNKYHLQALRHLYVLAVDTSRLLETIDVNSGANCSVSVRLELRRARKLQSSSDDVKSGEVKSTLQWQSLESPCLLPDLGSIKRILISSSAHYPVEILMSSLSSTKKKSSSSKQPKPEKSAAMTANALRLELLRGRNMILLKRTKRNEHTEGLAGISRELPALLSTSSSSQVGKQHEHDKDDRLVSAFQTYFLTRETPGVQLGAGDGASLADWWEVHSRQLVTYHVREDASSFLPIYLDALHALFRLQHVRFEPPASLPALRNLKLFLDYCEGQQQRRSRRSDQQRSRSQSVENDFCVWLKHQTEQALKTLWEKCASPTIASYSDVRDQIFVRSRTAGGGTPRTQQQQPRGGEEDARVIVNALVTYFAAPSTRMATSPEVWKLAFQQHAESSAPSIDGRQQVFELDKFLLVHQQQQQHESEAKQSATRDEKAFWLQLVSFFLFGV